VGVTVALGEIAGKKHGGFSLMAFEIRAEVHTGPATDAKVPFMNVLQELFRSIDFHHGNLSLNFFK